MWLLVLAACGSPTPDGTDRVFDPCDRTVIAAPTASADQLVSLDDALAMWGTRGVGGLVRGDAPAVTIEFRSASSSIYGFYDHTTATVYINQVLVDRSQRAVTIAHELGHALGLVHVDPHERISVMNPGNLTVAPTEADAATLAALWGSCPAAP